MKTIAVLSGAGISAESGLQTFRDSDGLWMGYNIYEVASPIGWAKNRKVVQDFYNMRRREALHAQPNAAHIAIAQLQSHFHIEVITQNIDDLHERAGSKNVLHLHGSILEMKSDRNENLITKVAGDVEPDAKADDGGFLRPNVVWFGEAVPNILPAIEIIKAADILIVIGTSLQVYPAASLVDYAHTETTKYLIDKNPPAVATSFGFEVIEMAATKGMEYLKKKLVL